MAGLSVEGVAVADWTKRGVDGGVDALGQPVALQIEAVDRALGLGDGCVVRRRRSG